MFSSLFKRSIREPKTAVINGNSIVVKPNETLLHAALRMHIDFPHSCRVGGCAQCKCRLVDGKVKELTDVGYILSDEEFENGFILACQSIPKTDISVEVDLSAVAPITRTGGRIIEQTKLTHDITELRIQLHDTVQYKPGQFANIALASLPDAFRSYSFASPRDVSGQVIFYVREVPNGKFSGAINQQDLVGTEVKLEGPMGDFWLRSGSEPIVMIAGGSGLAPIMGMLKQAVKEDHRSRDVTLLFGARSQQDLYKLEDIKKISTSWSGSFNFIPVLSEEPSESNWQGARGLVTEFIPESTTDGTQAYLCGPPAMIDAAESALLNNGINLNNLYADRFTTLVPVNTTNAA